MIDGIRKNTIKYGLYNAYIFNALYQYDFIKSKSFNLSQTSQDLQNKIMHIIKSSCNAVIKNENLEDKIINLTFNRNCLDIHTSWINLYTRQAIFSDKLQTLKENAALGLTNAINIYTYSSKVSFIFDGTSQIGITRGVSIVDQLNNIVNAVMYVPECIRKIAEAIGYIEQIGADYIHTYSDIFAILKTQGVNETRNPEIGACYDILLWIKLNHNDRFNDTCDYCGETMTASLAITELKNYYSYHQYSRTNSSILLICDKIKSFGEELGYNRAPGIEDVG